MKEIQALEIPHTLNRRITRAFRRATRTKIGDPTQAATIARLFDLTERHLRRFAARTADPRHFPD